MSDVVLEGAEPRPLRRDAAVNRDRILEAADEVLAEHGAGAAMDDIALRAGVGVGTLYRHFGAKEQLLAAVLERRVASVLERLRSLASVEPALAIDGLFDLFGELTAQKADFIDVLQAAGVDMGARFHDIGEELQAAVRPILERAQSSGVVRADVSSAELFGLVAGTCMAAEHAPADVRVRMLEVVREGLRAPGEDRPNATQR